MLIVPVAAAPPVTPFTCQVTPVLLVFVTVAVNCCVRPTCTDGVFGDSVTLIGSGATVIVALPDFVLSVTDVAVSVTVAGVGTVAGAVYVIATPDALAVVDKPPHVAPEQPAPPSVQFTPCASRSFVTVAVNVCVNPTVTVAIDGPTLTLTAGTTVIVDEKLALGSATEVALIVTSAGDGTAAGAV